MLHVSNNELHLSNKIKQIKKINKMATELKGIRIEIQTIKFLKKQANEEGRTFSGIVNKILKDYQNAKSKN